MREEKAQAFLNAALVTVAFFYIGPGIMIIQGYQFRVLGWPAFILWIAVLAPLTTLAIYLLKCRVKGELVLPFRGGGDS